jgi:type IX secretion system PorP/SprF family membrane protein
MKIVYTTLILALTFIGFTSRAQQLGLYNLYNQNIYLINPAAAGLNGCFNGFLNHRTQWNSIDNGPKLNGVTLNGRFANTHGIGANLQFSDIGLLSQFSGKLTYAYHLQTGRNSYLHAGISMGMNHQNFNTDDVIATDYTDDLLLQGQSAWGFANDVGLMFTTPRVRLGITVPQSFNVGQEINTGTGENVNAYAAYDLISSYQWKLESSILYRNSSEQDDQIDIGAKLMWKNIIGLGAIYRTNYGMATVAELNINDKLVVAYSYDFGGNNAISGRGGSHGIMLGIKLCRAGNQQSAQTIAPVTEPVKEVVMISEAPVEEEMSTAKNEATVPGKDKVVKRLDLDSVNQSYAHRDQMIRFKNASDDIVISDNLMRVVNEVAIVLNANPSFNVVIVGHASSVGGVDLNQQISDGRAKMVADELIKKGIDPVRIKQIGKGEQEPIADNATEYGASENRRVQVIFIKVE